MASLSAILRDNRYAPDDIPELESKLFFEGDRSRRYLVRFTVLLFLSTVIAANGVIEDSTATVIGAMIIAPLMTPILATTAALVMGSGPRAWRSVLLVVAGALGVIAVAAALGVPDHRPGDSARARSAGSTRCRDGGRVRDESR